MEDEELPLSIPVKALWEHMTCPICMSVLCNTYMTPCGHRYCKECIIECVNRRHKCPCCNTDVHKVRDLLHDHQFDVLIQNIREAKEMAEKTYFEELIHTVVSNANSLDVNNSHSPVEEVLKKHLKEGLAAHENYYQELRTQCNHQIQMIEKELAGSTAELQKQTQVQTDFEVKLKDLNEKYEYRKQTFLSELENCGRMLSQAYDRYLTEHLPTPSLLPIKVSLVLLNKEITFSDVQIKPNYSISHIQDILKSKMHSRDDPIITFDDDVRFILVGPFVKRSLSETHQLVNDVVQHEVVHTDVVLLPRNCCPILQFGAKSGSEIIITGRVKSQSDLPKLCFATTFEEGRGDSVDYFTCRDCGFNWVCKPCKESCHKDHMTVPYIMNHHPTWACCYCPKKKKCVLSS
ncbi:uncharacterized protein LOC102803824 [Saccoglossus kowalevskii]|uniref:Tripartite motif-containing protein 12A-like n=1 Tax=Saccoglossus kowalevskii TaxID=10224 RepID=A0ABM0LV69_SACKO|nr:PREDICTED: tripartite motif-containing protein 12A-like [Saccoglossus kowalevskii]